MSKESQKFVRVEVAGKSSELWSKLRGKLLEVIDQILDTVIDSDKHTTLKQEAQKFTSAILDYGKQKLAQPGYENEKTIAEVELLYSQKQRELAEARKVNAEADKLELDNTIRKLRVFLIAIRRLLHEMKQTICCS